MLFIVAIHKMTERTLAASPNMDVSQLQRSDTPPLQTEVYFILKRKF